jgi:hypothetical protein
MCEFPVKPDDHLLYSSLVMKLYRRLLSCPGITAFLAAGVLACGGGSIGGSTDAGVDAVSCPGSEPVTLYRDGDGDGFGDPAQPMSACGPVDGFVTSSSDCHDGDEQVNPNGVEVCGDDVDNDCSGDDACQASLLAHWPLGDGSGSTAADVSGHDHDGTLRNAPEWSSDGPYLHFDGAQRYVEVPNSLAFLIDQGTVVLWFRADELTLAHGLWSKDSSGLDSGGHLTLQTTAEGASPARVRVRLQHADVNVGNEGGNYLYSTAIESNRWYHLALSFGPEGMRLYLDAALVDANAYTGGLGQTSGGLGNEEPIVIGASTATSGDFSATPISIPHMGDIADVRFYGRALSADELAELHELIRPVP